MKNEFFLSQRLGFSNAQADSIRQMGSEDFLKRSFDATFEVNMPDFLDDAPKNIKEFRKMKKMNEDKKKLVQISERLRTIRLQNWWIERMYLAEFPLREKMVLFWHNHFVSSIQKVKSTWGMYQQNNLFRENAFGNFKTLTIKVLYDNAMLIYLDNTQNRARAINENLSRELLELFTLGTGNYTESDIKAGAAALAGLNISDNGGKYYEPLEDNGQKTYLGKTGNWKAKDLVDLIFEHPKAAHRLTEKLLKFFVSDNPSSQLIDEYALFLKKQNFEIKPFLTKLVVDQRFMNSKGDKIKDPLSFLLGVFHEFQITDMPMRSIYQYLREQNMELFNPPNVKGWDGGKTWLSAQKLLQRVGVISILCSGKNFSNFKFKEKEMMEQDQREFVELDAKKIQNFKANLRWDKNAINNKLIINELSGKHLFDVSKDLQQDMERILKYDFDPKLQNAHLSVTRLAEFIFKSPEYQII
ncbi:MAG: hypothetical protein RIS64_4124 [Bacteroidota bacterium]|jgi:uncharacterized protein (DUF1800 family)